MADWNVRADIHAERLEAHGWQPIETAPKDGASVLLFMPDRICEGWFAKGEWSEDTPISPAEYSGEVWVCCDDEFQVEVELGPEGYESHGPITHWMPLPSAPKAALAQWDAGEDKG